VQFLPENCALCELKLPRFLPPRLLHSHVLLSYCVGVHAREYVFLGASRCDILICSHLSVQFLSENLLISRAKTSKKFSVQALCARSVCTISCFVDWCANTTRPKSWARQDTELWRRMLTRSRGLSFGALLVDHKCPAQKGLENRQDSRRESACSIGSGKWIRSIRQWGRTAFIARFQWLRFEPRLTRFVRGLRNSASRENAYCVAVSARKYAFLKAPRSGILKRLPSKCTIFKSASSENSVSRYKAFFCSHTYWFLGSRGEEAESLISIASSKELGRMVTTSGDIMINCLSGEIVSCKDCWCLFRGNLGEFAQVITDKSLNFVACTYGTRVSIFHVARPAKRHENHNCILGRLDKNLISEHYIM